MYAWGDGQANKAGTCMLYNATGNLHQKLNTIHKDYSCRAEINPQPRESHSGQKLVIANQWVSGCNSNKSHLTKAEPAGQ